MLARPTSARSITCVDGFEEAGPLWNTIRKHLYKSEVAHVKRLVGVQLIQQTKTAWRELTSLREILSEFQKQNDELSDGLLQQIQFCGTQHRDLLRRQAQIMLDDIRSQVESCGHTIEDVVPELQDSQFRDCLYSVGSSGALGRSCPATPSTRPSSSSGYSASPEPSGGLPALPLGRQLGLEDLTQVAAGIREALESEHEALLSAIAEQTEHLEEEASRHAEVAGRARRGELPIPQLQKFVHRLQDLSTSPNLRTLALTPANLASFEDSPGGVVRPAPVLGGSHIRRLQALIAQRRALTPRPPDSGISALPPPMPKTMPPDRPPAVPSGQAAVFDPFFDDPALFDIISAAKV